MDDAALNDSQCLQEPIGNLDGIFEKKLRGWFLCDETSPFNELVLVINGVDSVQRAVPTERPDVQAVHHCKLKCGFQFNLKNLKDDEIFTLQVRHAKSDFKFSGAKFSYCTELNTYTDDLRQIFSAEFYRHKYALENLNKAEALEHYLNVGIQSNFDPCPWFSSEYYISKHEELIGNHGIAILSYLVNEAELQVKPCESFDPSHYLATNPDLNPSMGLLKHYATQGYKEGRKKVQRKLPQHVVEELDELLDLEPKLMSAKNRLSEIVRYPRLTGATFLPKVISQRYGDRIKAVICVPFISRGGADLISTFVLRAYEQHYGTDHVLMIVTDAQEQKSPDWIHSDSNMLQLDQEGTFLNFDEKVFALHHIIGQLAPEKIVNVNSHAGWQMYRQYGRQLASAANLYAYLFCFDYDDNGHKVGYIVDYVADVIPFLSRVFCDNKQIVKDINSLYGFSGRNRDVFEHVYVPVPSDLEISARDYGTQEAGILWVGRLCHQKRPDLLVLIASAMPSKSFYVYGSAGNSPVSTDIINGVYDNIVYLGVYDSLNEIDCSKISTYLNTSQWDGMPTIIIQMAAMGIPVVTSNVGGISELIDETTGWIIEDNTDVDEYVTQLKRRLLMESETSLKVKNALDRTKQHHTWAAFIARMVEVDAFTEHKEENLRNYPVFERRSA